MSFLCLSLCIKAVEYPIDRLDQRSLPLDSTYTYDRTGSGIHTYLVDDTLRYTHQEFGGRADIVYDPCNLNPSSPGLNHGTMVAGLLGSSSYGAATSSYIHLVSNCSPPPNYPNPLIAAANWITTNRIDPAVVVISYNSRFFGAAEVTAINTSISSGVTWVVAAGNDSADACPQTQLDAIVVGALYINSAEYLTSYSNYGSCVTLFASGGGTSTTNTSDTATTSFYGTSASTPLVGGVVALMREADPNASPTTIKQRLIDWSTKGEISGNLNGSPNRIAYSLETTISGKVTNAFGIALSNIAVKLTDSNGGYRLATTSSFGLYRFENVIPYDDYTVTASSKRYRFAPQVLNDVTVSLTDVDLIGLE